jgi:23S rRNA pseudouridine2604 synthase
MQKGRSKQKTQKTKQAPQTPTEKPLFPMRINKFLALKNHATRRGADELISQKKVFINGVLAVLGSKVAEHDIVEVRRKANTAPKYAYYAYNKPIGLVTSAQTPSEKDIVRSLPKEISKLKLFPLGRLDKNSHGLIILTNDGRVTDRLLNPKYEHEKEYEVTVTKPLRANFREKIGAGVNIEGYITKPAKVKILNERKFLITLVEGKTHQIRRMMSALFNEVADLKRVGVMNIRLDNLPVGAFREITGPELEVFLNTLNLTVS